MLKVAEIKYEQVIADFHRSLSDGEDYSHIEGKADLFDLQHYIALDNGKLFKDDRREFRQATYAAILTTLAQQPLAKPSDGVEEVKSSEPDVKQKLLLIIENAIAKEKQFEQSSSQEFVDILQGLKNNLDQVIRQYQRFPKIFAADLNQKTQTTTYGNVLSSLQQEKPVRPSTSITYLGDDEVDCVESQSQPPVDSMGSIQSPYVGPQSSNEDPESPAVRKPCTPI